MIKAYSFRVHGRVQGVGFRFFTERQAHKCKVSGWVRNEVDGTVSGFVQGDENSVERFNALIRKGPSTSYVKQLDLIPAAPRKDLDNFVITY